MAQGWAWIRARGVSPPHPGATAAPIRLEGGPASPYTEPLKVLPHLLSFPPTEPIPHEISAILSHARPARRPDRAGPGPGRARQGAGHVHRLPRPGAVAVGVRTPVRQPDVHGHRPPGPRLGL